MSLKKSDKIIALIGVAIIIIAAVGIFFYVESEEDVDREPFENGDEKKTFKIVYDLMPMSTDPDNTNYQIKPKLRLASWVGHVSISQQNIKSITVLVNYDDKAGIFRILGRLKFIGKDTLSITVTDSQGNVIGSGSIPGDGMVNITGEIGSMIALDEIEAEDIIEARELLEERYFDYEETYTISITLKTGIWGKFRELLGKHSFGLRVSYDYYDYMPVEVIKDENPPEIPPTGVKPSVPGAGVYTITNFPLTKL